MLPANSKTVGFVKKNSKVEIYSEIIIKVLNNRIGSDKEVRTGTFWQLTPPQQSPESYVRAEMKRTPHSPSWQATEQRRLTPNASVRARNEENAMKL